MYVVMVAGERAYGIEVHPGQGFYFRGVECKTGKLLFRTECKDYQAKPEVTLINRLYGNFAVAQVSDRQDFQVKVFSVAEGKDAYTLADKGVGPFGVHGRISGTVQSGRVILLSKDKLGM